MSDYRVWHIIYNFNSLSKFPALLPVLTKYADGGFAPAQCLLSYMYSDGDDFKKNAEKSVHYARLSSDQGYAKGQTWMGRKYFKGEGVLENKAEATRLFILAAEQRYVIAKLFLGECYSIGAGVEKSEDQALKYYFEANIPLCKDKIIDYLTPVTLEKTVKNFNENNFFADIEEELGVLVSLYHTDVPLDLTRTNYLQTHSKDIAAYRTWIYDMLVNQVSPLVNRLKTVGPGFLINCMKIKEGVTISRTKTNPAPSFSHWVYMTQSKKNLISLGEENAIITAQLSSVGNFFLDGIKIKQNEILQGKDNSLGTEAEILTLIEGKKKILRDLEIKRLSLNQLLTTANEKTKSIYENKILENECDIELVHMEMSNLNKGKEDETYFKDELSKFKKVTDLLISYIEDGVHGRNEIFLEHYPYLRT